jgi:hypothetical protein
VCVTFLLQALQSSSHISGLWVLAFRLGLDMSLSQPVDITCFLGRPGDARLLAEQVLHEHSAKHAGHVQVSSLQDLYRSKPWLQTAVGRLESFCCTSTSLNYRPHAAGIGIETVHVLW